MVDYDDKQLTLGLGPAGCHANGWFELHVYDDDNERLGMTNIFVNVTSKLFLVSSSDDITLIVKCIERSWLIIN